MERITKCNTTRFLVVFLLISVFVSCAITKKQQNESNSKSKEKLALEQRIPDGYQVPEYKPLQATANIYFEAAIYPSSWWIGLKNPVLELMIHDQNAKTSAVEVNYPGVRVRSSTSLENPNYLFVELEISPDATAGDVELKLINASSSKSHKLKLLQRNNAKTKAQGLNPADFVYLIMPDRFSNGNPANDAFADMNQKDIRRDKLYFRHGGDIQGVKNHIDYLKELGVTAVWMTPVLENNQPYESYHGYAITDHYQIDKRLGSNELYVEFVDAMHQQGMKVVKDMIFNHVGNQHFFIRDLPSEDWIHNLPDFKRSNYRDQVHYDPYASASDKATMLEGWFDFHMPDLNQKNEKLARYLIQNSIWWIEYAGIDAIRVDTYPYNDQEFMQNWSKAILEEYPEFYICVESYVTGVNNQAYFTENEAVKAKLGDKQIYPIDFQLQYAISDALTKPQGWVDGVSKLYHTLCSDYLQRNPQKNLLFLDNHDMSRFFSVVNEDKSKLKSALAWLLTERGIPQIYYGTEILMRGISNPDGYVRADFPGGWDGDKSNKFKSKGRTKSENELFRFVSKLAKYRKNSDAIQNGKRIHYIPKDGVYSYFRYSDKACVLVVMNTSDKVQRFDATRHAELLDKYAEFYDVVEDKKLDPRQLKLDRFETIVIECRKK